MKFLNPVTKTIISSVFAGISISIGAFIYLKTQGALGAFLCSFGFMAILFYKFILYTGCLHKASNLSEHILLGFVMLLNILGCLIASLCVNNPAIVEQCQNIVLQRESIGFPLAIIKGIGCGFIITLAFQSWDVNKLVLLFGIPVFVVAGFMHSITDAFYYCVGWSAISSGAMVTFIGTLIGNFIGALAYRLGTEEKKK